jgi:hypothetical protein
MRLTKKRFIRRDQSDFDGSFHLTNIMPGEYTLLAIDDGRDLAYKHEALIKPYLPSGVPLKIPREERKPLRVDVQHRKSAEKER